MLIFFEKIPVFMTLFSFFWNQFHKRPNPLKVFTKIDKLSYVKGQGGYKK